MTEAAGVRRAGVLVPLFAAPSSISWGIGEIGDIPALASWLAKAGQQILQLLPLNEMAPGQHSPYSAISAMAIDPIFISVAAVPDFLAAGGVASLSRDDRHMLAHVRNSPRIEYANVRALKQRALEAAFSRFFETEWSGDTDRASGLKTFIADQAWWLDEYVLFRAIHSTKKERPWTAWPVALRRRDPRVLAQLRKELSKELLFQAYLQWLAYTQWMGVRRRTQGVRIFGDLPFMVGSDSADVWARQDQFRLDVSIGVPPDAFSATGQDWGMPLSRWDVMADDGFRWVRERARRNADLYDGFRVDHLVGFYRTYGRPRNGGPPFFVPASEIDQTALGETVLQVLRDAGAEIIAEDLGDVPDFVRVSLTRLGIPGFRVFCWERLWHTEDAPFRDPMDYPPLSVATSGTHDTEPMLAWWQHAAEGERELVDAIPTMRRVTRGLGILDAEPGQVRDALLETLFASGSNLVILPIQDVFGWSDRINTPATVGESNWVFRLPWPTDRLDEVAEARERQARLRAWAEEYHRVGE